MISGVITGVTAGAMGFIEDSPEDADLLLLAAFFLAGFFLAAALRAGFFFAPAFLEDDFFFDAFFFDDFFFATRFLEDFLDDFFLAVFFLEEAFFLDDAFFFAAMFNSFQCWTDLSLVRAAGGGFFVALPTFRFASNEMVIGFYSQHCEITSCQA